MLTIIIIAIGLSMDSFAVSITKGLLIKKNKVNNALKFALIVLAFHFAMPIIGWLAGSGLKNIVSTFDHWLAFILLTAVGVKAIYEAIAENETDKLERKTNLELKTALTLATATSIDALIVGGSLAFLKIDIWISCAIIGLTAGLFSLLGFYLGDKFGKMIGNKAAIFGGLVLIGIGVKTLLEHLL